MKRVSAAMALVTVMPASLQAGNVQAEHLSTEWREDPWWTLHEVQEHLFPHTEDAPGAKDIRATLYLKKELPSPWIDEEERTFIIKGVDWLNDMAKKMHGARFVDLDHNQREDVLRQIEKSQVGERWISLIIYYIMEALLTDPVYGGNPEQIGWKWLSHHAGFPRPPVDKLYYKLR